ncbi:MAG: DNA helicase UvrD [Nitrospira sp. SB0666_bin_27]|nr:DNA helicase UvrD [Nitrospira sp. SB0666_bin_27]
MSFIADLHIHSRYSRAVSKDMVPESLYRWAQLKGITVVGTGDFTHPAWFAELQEKLEPAEQGLYRLKPELAAPVDAGIPESCRADVRFMLTSEISSIYKRHERTRKVHNLIFAPSFSAVANMTDKLARIGNLHSDGRPILGLDSEELLRIMIERAPESLFVPAHAWTPHFSVFGANSGFDSLEECFGDLSPHIQVIETGLSSDPPMNWRLSQLDGITLISNSDAHSPSKLGREANVLNGDLSFEGIKAAFTSGDPALFQGTIEFFPEEGKYHFDGHRNCRVRMSPEEARAHDDACPECGKPVTRGVMHRVEILADQPAGHRARRALSYRSVVPLVELIAEVRGAGVNTKGVTEAYHQLLASLGNEFEILMNVPIAAIEENAGMLLALAIQRMREGNVTIAPGYDGEYGTVRLLSQEDRQSHASQTSLF